MHIQPGMVTGVRADCPVSNTELKALLAGPLHAAIARQREGKDYAKTNDKSGTQTKKKLNNSTQNGCKTKP